MNMVYSIDEVFEIAEQIERNGVLFYRKAAEITGDGASSEMFNYLAEQEAEHEKTFASLRRELVPEEGSVAANDKDDIVAIYLQALAGQSVFSRQEDPSDRLEGDESVGDILRIAIGKERDSIIYYASIRGLLADDEDRKKIDSIIREEQRHVENLQEREENL